jgi:hypothetical protein
VSRLHGYIDLPILWVSTRQVLGLNFHRIVLLGTLCVNDITVLVFNEDGEHVECLRNKQATFTLRGYSLRYLQATIKRALAAKRTACAQVCSNNFISRQHHVD